MTSPFLLSVHILLLLSLACILPAEKPNALEEAVQNLNFPHVWVNIEKRAVDVEAKVCLRHGLLELVLCKKEGKVHESIVSTGALPSHIHAALLLLGTEQGAPAKREVVNQETQEWRDFLPSGGKVEVSFIKINEAGKEVTLPLADCIKRVERDNENTEEKTPFHTNTFLFAGSQIIKREGEKPLYLCDNVGNIISLSTFGDELLCLPGIHAHANDSLNWEVNPTRLPELGEPLLVRLKPLL